MFPKDTITTDVVSAEEKGVGRSVEFDFTAGGFVVKDGKVSEISAARAVRQWIELLLRTSLNRFKIYDGTDFGLSLDRYIGYKKSNLAFVESELKREITEKLLANRAIEGLSDFKTSPEGDVLNISFTVTLSNGENMEVSAGV